MKSVETLSCLLMGPPGIGKTSLLRSIPDGEEVLVLAPDPGLLCVADLVESGKITGFEINSFQDIKEAYDLLRTEEYQKKYKWVVIDHLTELSEIVLNEARNKFPAKADSFNMYNEFSRKMTFIIKIFRDLPMNVIMISLVTYDKDETNKRVFMPDIGTSSMRPKIPSFFDLCLYYDMIPFSGEDKPRRSLVTGWFNNFDFARDRSGKLSLFEKPDLGYIKNKIFDKTKQPKATLPETKK